MCNNNHTAYAISCVYALYHIWHIYVYGVREHLLWIIGVEGWLMAVLLSSILLLFGCYTLHFSRSPMPMSRPNNMWPCGWLLCVIYSVHLANAWIRRLYAWKTNRELASPKVSLLKIVQPVQQNEELKRTTKSLRGLFAFKSGLLVREFVYWRDPAGLAKRRTKEYYEGF